MHASKHQHQHQHIATVLQVAADGVRAAVAARHAQVIRDAWLCCVQQPRLDPTRRQESVILPRGWVRERQDQLEAFLHVARHGLESFYAKVAGLGHRVLSADARGLTVEFLGDLVAEPSLREAGLYLDADGQVLAHLLCLPLPDDWPVFAPKDKAGDWLAMDTKVMEISCWGSTTAKQATFDEASGRWARTVDRDGHAVLLRPKRLGPGRVGLAQRAPDQRRCSSRRAAKGWTRRCMARRRCTTCAEPAQRQAWSKKADNSPPSWLR